ncbi:MAG: hypothetical protein KAI64_01275 [Thermoplasmata archaeon]|nr:hypothetical protein [Thermoplasmata archaeon]
MSGDDFVAVAARGPGLLIRLFFSYLRFKRKVKKGTKAFRKELIRRGIPRETATMLANEFSSAAEMFSIRDMSRMI